MTSSSLLKHSRNQKYHLYKSPLSATNKVNWFNLPPTTSFLISAWHSCHRPLVAVTVMRFPSVVVVAPTPRLWVVPVGWFSVRGVVGTIVDVGSLPAAVVFSVLFRLKSEKFPGVGVIGTWGMRRTSCESSQESVAIASVPRMKEMTPMTTPLIQIKRKYRRITIVNGVLSLLTAGGGTEGRWWLEFVDATLGPVRGYHPAANNYQWRYQIAAASTQLRYWFACGWFLKAQSAKAVVVLVSMRLALHIAVSYVALTHRKH